jgi:hypothetical protein
VDEQPRQLAGLEAKRRVALIEHFEIPGHEPDARIAVETRTGEAEEIGTQPIVSVETTDVPSRRKPNSFVARRRQSEIVLPNDSGTWPVEVCQEKSRVGVGRAVIDDDDLEVATGLGEYRLDRLMQVATQVVTRNHHTHRRRVVSLERRHVWMQTRPDPQRQDVTLVWRQSADAGLVPQAGPFRASQGPNG